MVGFLFGNLRARHNDNERNLGLVGDLMSAKSCSDHNLNAR